MVHPVLFAASSMPFDVVPLFRKLNILLLLIVLPLFVLAAVPAEKTAFNGLLTSAALVILLLSIVLPSFPVVPEVVLKLN